MRTRGARARPSARVLPRSDDKSSLARSVSSSVPPASARHAPVREREGKHAPGAIATAPASQRARLRTMPDCARQRVRKRRRQCWVRPRAARASRAHARTRKRERARSRRPHAAARSGPGTRAVMRHALTPSRCTVRSHGRPAARLRARSLSPLPAPLPPPPSSARPRSRVVSRNPREAGATQTING